VVSAISVFEITVAARRGRFDVGDSVSQWLSDLLVLPELQFEPVSLNIARRAAELPDAVSRDPGDRIIAATALELGARLVTVDQQLRAIPGLEVVW
jgi:PIN domain nuclease of toxin-antitoxin system